MKYNLQDLHENCVGWKYTEVSETDWPGLRTAGGGGGVSQALLTLRAGTHPSGSPDRDGSSSGGRLAGREQLAKQKRDTTGERHTEPLGGAACGPQPPSSPRHAQSSRALASFYY